MTFLDTNVFIYAAGRESAYKASCARILADVVRGSFPAAISSEVCQEVMYIYHRRQRSDLAVEVVDRILKMPLTVLPVGKVEMDLAVAIYRETQAAGLPPRDAIHVAVMRQNAIRRVISTDPHFDVLEDIERVDPQDYAGSQ
jgi:uncharacterized protein